MVFAYCESVCGVLVVVAEWILGIPKLIWGFWLYRIKSLQYLSIWHAFSICNILWVITLLLTFIYFSLTISAIFEWSCDNSDIYCTIMESFVTNLFRFTEAWLGLFFNFFLEFQKRLTSRQSRESRDLYNSLLWAYIHGRVILRYNFLTFLLPAPMAEWSKA